nr:PorP/SprF family type IX secretion system membrane protein [Bacteroidota bacterium]
MKKVFILILIIAGANLLNAQDAHFSQFYNTPTFINPATVGDIKHDHRVALHYRDQWRVATAPYQTMAFSYDYKFNLKDDGKDIIGLGAQVIKDIAGETGYDVSQVLATFAYHKKLTRYQMFSFGMQGGMRQHSMNFEDGKWGSQYNGKVFDPGMSSGESFYNQSVFVADVNAGAQYTLMPSKYFNAKLGAAIHHLPRPIVKFIGNGKREEYRFVSHLSMDIASPDHNVSFIPNVLFMQQGKAQEITGGGMVRFGLKGQRNFGPFRNENGISFGSFYRLGDALVFATQLEYGPYAFGFSYDTNISRLSDGTRGVGGFEIGIRYIS